MQLNRWWILSLWCILSFSIVYIPQLTLAAPLKNKKKVVVVPIDITKSSKYAALVLDEKTGKILHEKYSKVRRHPASITKNLTLYLTFEALEAGKLKMHQRLPISERAAIQPPTRLGLKAGRTITVRDAIDGMIVKSANDAAVVLAEAIAGTEWQFAKMMNLKAAQLGLNDSNFANSHGLFHADQYTTAHDMGKLALCLIKHYPKYYPLFNKTSFTFEGKIIVGHNRVMNRYHGAEGMKTGFINASGFNLVTVVNRPQGRLVGVVLGGQTPKVRDDHMIAILDDGYIKLAAANNPINKYAQYAPTQYVPQEDSAISEEKNYEDAGDQDIFEELDREEKLAENENIFGVIDNSSAQVQLMKASDTTMNKANFNNIKLANKVTSKSSNKKIVKTTSIKNKNLKKAKSKNTVRSKT